MSWFSRPPQWARRIPAGLRPSKAAVEAIEAIRQRTGQTHDHLFAHVLGHPETTRKVMRQDYERAKARWPTAAPRELLQAVLLSRVQASFGTPGRPLFGITPQYGEPAMRASIERTLARYGDLAALTDAIIADEGRRAIPPWPGREADADQISEVLRRDR